MASKKLPSSTGYFNKETAKKYVNISLRSIQQQTGGILWRLKNSKLSTSN